MRCQVLGNHISQQNCINVLLKKRVLATFTDHIDFILLFVLYLYFKIFTETTGKRMREKS